MCDEYISTSKFVHGRCNTRSTNTCQIQACQNNLWANFYYSPTNPITPILNYVVVVNAWCSRFVYLLSCFVGQFAISSTHLFAWPSMSYDHEEIRIFSDQCNFSVAPAKILDSNMLLKWSTTSLLVSHSRWVQPTKTSSRNDVGSPKSTSFMSIFRVGLMSCFFSSQLDVVQIHRIRIVLFLVNGLTLTIWNFSQPYSKRASSNCLSQQSCHRMTVQISLKRNGLDLP